MAPVRGTQISALKSIVSARKLINPAYSLSFSDHYFRDINATCDQSRQSEGWGMAGKTVVVRLNQQQLELLDRTIERGEAPDRVALIRKALREQAAKRRDGGAR
jgi:hypothetical protein